VLVFLAQDIPFFWDTVQLGAKHAWFYYDTGFRTLWLPTELDSGHPPTFGLYLAGLWSMFTPSLSLSHWALLPFLMGVLLLAYELGRELGDERWAPLLPLLLLADPTVLAQSVLLSPELPLLFFFLLGLYSVERQNRFALILAALGLALISTRGMMCCLILFGYQWRREEHSWRRPMTLFWASRYYWPAALLAVFFLWGHYRATGWIGYHADSPWGPSFKTVDTEGMLRNLLILIWRLLDFGRILIYPLLLAMWLTTRTGFRPKKQRRDLSWLLLLALGILSISFLRYQGLQQHRYLLPVFIAVHLLFYLLVCHGRIPTRWKQGFAALALVGLLSGHFWIYPHRIAQGWDASLSFLPYTELRAESLAFLQQRQIPAGQVGTAFPAIGPLHHRNPQTRGSGFHAYDMETSRYIFYSNVVNDFSDRDIRRLRSQWTLLYSRTQRGVEVSIYQRPN